jgi:hypothetical protein
MIDEVTYENENGIVGQNRVKSWVVAVTAFDVAVLFTGILFYVVLPTEPWAESWLSMTIIIAFGTLAMVADVIGVLAIFQPKMVLTRRAFQAFCKVYVALRLLLLVAKCIVFCYIIVATTTINTYV